MEGSSVGSNSGTLSNHHMTITLSSCDFYRHQQQTIHQKSLLVIRISYQSTHLLFWINITFIFDSDILYDDIEDNDDMEL